MPKPSDQGTNMDWTWIPIAVVLTVAALCKLLRHLINLRFLWRIFEAEGLKGLDAAADAVSKLTGQPPVTPSLNHGESVDDVPPDDVPPDDNHSP